MNAYDEEFTPEQQLEIDRENAEVEAEFQNEQHEAIEWSQRKAEFLLWMLKEGLVVTEDLAMITGRSKRSINEELLSRGEEPALNGKKVKEGNNIWRKESLSKSLGESIASSTPSGGQDTKVSAKPSGATKPKRTAKRSNSKKD